MHQRNNYSTPLLRLLPILALSSSGAASIYASVREQRISLFAVAALSIFLAGCVSMHELKWSKGEQIMVNEVMYFGQSKPNGMVTEKEWSDFLSMEVTPRFPRGISVWHAAGQWLAANGATGHEHSYVLNLVHPDTKTDELAVREIMAKYKRQFQQEGVLRVKSRVCVSR